ncbi:MAG: inositol monophosphatase [Burkholderiales bacterium]|nr:inositol monophosphatase [Burkholderiales bacterium]
MQPMLKTAIDAARAAGTLINRAALNLDQIKVGQKSAHEYVTEIDQEAENIIREQLLTAYPKHAFEGEESGVSGHVKSNCRWIVDPIDGTTNFIHGLPHYAISIAMEQEGKIEHAVIYNPATNDLFTASRGSGAFLNNRRIRVSTRTRLSESLLSHAMPIHTLKSRPELVRLQTALRFGTSGLRNTGSAALDLAYVAAGYIDGFVGAGLKNWDMAAGALLVKEAGGLLTDFTGEGDFMAGDVLAATPKLLPALLREINPDHTVVF